METIKPIDAFYDLPAQQPGGMQPAYGNAQPTNTMNIGAGANGFYIDKDGLRLGGKTAATAPFSVDMNGNINAQSFNGLNIVLYNNGIPQIVIGTG